MYSSSRAETAAIVNRGYDINPRAIQGREYECPNNCGRKYKYRQSMMLHYKRECGKEPQFECEYCPKRFAHKGSLRNHVGLVHKVIC